MQGRISANPESSNRFEVNWSFARLLLPIMPIRPLIHSQHDEIIAEARDAIEDQVESKASDYRDFDKPARLGGGVVNWGDRF